MYGGPLEFLFVVESKDDPAYDRISQLALELKVSMHMHVRVSCVLLYLGLVQQCGQSFAELTDIWNNCSVVIC